VLQLEDCVDCLSVLFPDHEFLFLLEHSCRHDRQREDCLNAEDMKRSFGGNKPKMRDTRIEQEKGYLGPYCRQLHPGDTQKMIFTPDDIGPFWMCYEEQEKWRHDIVIEGQVVKQKLAKKELIQVLLTRGITMKGRLVDLQRAATNSRIALEEISTKVLEGWEGKPKRLLRVLWEQCWIDDMDGRAYNNYTIAERKNEFNHQDGGIIEVSDGLLY
jgi:hypothetical protein